MKTPYELGFECGYYGQVYKELYREYSREDMEYKQGYTNGVRQAKLEVDKHNDFVDNMKRERQTA